MTANVKDYKKEYKKLYQPKTAPEMVEVGEMQFVAVEGRGNPNDENGEFGAAIKILYAIQYTIKMSKKGKTVPEGYFDYVVPPLEGFWTVENKADLKDKSKFFWTAVIRLPEFVDKEIFDRACNEVIHRKNINTEKAKYIRIKEGLCVQCMHIGPFDDEPATIAKMEKFMEENNLANDITATRHHHEIYLSDFRKTDASKLKTVLRIPVKRKEG
ncbi:MAG: GyrI-like domain-containing protein [Tannerella sp.]|jgi:hypothetical protein|nr:GyrI-like domain-containing protein [Tannerella sp.]